MSEEPLDESILRPHSSEEVERLASHSSDLLRAFTAISRALNLGQPLSLTLDLIAEKVSQTMGRKYCAIMLFHEETGEFLIEGSYGLPQEYVEKSNAILKQIMQQEGDAARSVTLQAFKTQMPTYIRDVTTDPRFGPWRELATKARFNSVVSLPLVFRAKPIGVLNCYDEPRSYSEAQVEALMVVAGQAASAVGIARLLLEQRKTIRQLDVQHDLLKRSEEVHGALTTLLLEDCSLDDITATLSELLGLPVVLQEQRLRIRSRVDPAGSGYMGLPPDALTRPEAEATLAGLRGSGRTGRVEIRGPEGFSSLVAHVVAGGNGYGYLSVPAEGNQEQEGLLRRALEQGATVYALYIMKQRAAQEAESRVKGELLLDLIEGRVRDVASTRERAHHLGLDLETPYRILLVKPGPRIDGTGPEPAAWGEAQQVRRKLAAVTQGFAARIGPVASTAVGDSVAALLPQSDKTDVRRTAERLLATVANELEGLPTVRVGASGLCTRLPDFPKRYKEILALLDLVERLEVPGRTVCYDDWRMYGLLMQSNSPDELQDLAHRTLDPVIGYDREAQGNALDTLRAYLDNDLSPTRTARALYVHPNTVKYRLNRISKLTGEDLSNLESIMTTKISMMVRDLDPVKFDRSVEITT